VYNRNNGTWNQQAKLIGSGAFGNSVALSADGNTALVGGPYDNSQVGAAWVFTRSNGTWTQQGGKLTATDAASGSVYQGYSVALSADGNTARPASEPRSTGFLRAASCGQPRRGQKLFATLRARGDTLSPEGAQDDEGTTARAQETAGGV
jgi:hypothetical protein